MRFVIKYPTRGRPAQFIRMVNRYRAMSSHRNPMRFVVSIDNDDRTMHAKDVQGFLSRQRDTQVFSGNSRNKIEAINADFDKLGEYDVLILAADDMQVQVKGYDTIIKKLMEEHFPNLDGCINAWDGANKKRLMTQIIAGKKLLDSWGYIYHPDYIATHCDDEADAVTQRDGKQFRTDLVLFRHEWLQHTGKDDTYRRNEGFWSKDKATFERRMAEGFPK